MRRRTDWPAYLSSLLPAAVCAGLAFITAILVFGILGLTK